MIGEFIKAAFNWIVSEIRRLIDPEFAAKAKALDRKADQAHADVQAATTHERESELRDAAATEQVAVLNQESEANAAAETANQMEIEASKRRMADEAARIAALDEDAKLHLKV